MSQFCLEWIATERCIHSVRWIYLTMPEYETKVTTAITSHKKFFKYSFF